MNKEFLLTLTKITNDNVSSFYSSDTLFIVTEVFKGKTMYRGHFNITPQIKSGTYCQMLYYDNSRGIVSKHRVGFKTTETDEERLLYSKETKSIIKSLIKNNELYGKEIK